MVRSYIIKKRRDGTFGAFTPSGNLIKYPDSELVIIGYTVSEIRKDMVDYFGKGKYVELVVDPRGFGKSELPYVKRYLTHTDGFESLPTIEKALLGIGEDKGVRINGIHGHVNRLKVPRKDSTLNRLASEILIEELPRGMWNNLTRSIVYQAEIADEIKRAVDSKGEVRKVLDHLKKVEDLKHLRRGKDRAVIDEIREKYALPKTKATGRVPGKKKVKKPKVIVISVDEAKKLIPKEEVIKYDVDIPTSKPKKSKPAPKPVVEPRPKKTFGITGVHIKPKTKPKFFIPEPTVPKTKPKTPGAYWIPVDELTKSEIEEQLRLRKIAHDYWRVGDDGKFNAERKKNFRNRPISEYRDVYVILMEQDKLKRASKKKKVTYRHPPIPLPL